MSRILVAGSPLEKQKHVYLYSWNQKGIKKGDCKEKSLRNSLKRGIGKNLIGKKLGLVGKRAVPFVRLDSEFIKQLQRCTFVAPKSSFPCTDSTLEGLRSCRCGRNMLKHAFV